MKKQIASIILLLIRLLSCMACILIMVVAWNLSVESLGMFRFIVGSIAVSILGFLMYGIE
jgi:hypothetical protein